MEIGRRDFLKLAAAASAVAACPSFVRAAVRPRYRRCIVLGIDGMDPGLASRYMREGLLPNFKRLAESGHFSALGTSMPPQSPVAWSNFISGAGPGVHGIFDFIARDAATLTPYLSTSRLAPASRSVTVGRWRMPLGGGRMENLRQGPSLWCELERRGVAATVLRIPANFPPVASGATTLSGLGTPDIHGGYGIFTFFTDRIGERTRDVAGGRIERVRLRGNVAEAVIPGPKNSFDAASGGTATVGAPFSVAVNSSGRMVRIQVQEVDFLLREGVWSEWVPLKFRLMPGVAAAHGICRFFLKSAAEPFALYATPVNLDPMDPDLPLSTPAGYSAELARRVGRYYTQGMAEDTSALSAGVFDDALFRNQSLEVLRESWRIYESELPRFREGLFFFYFSCLDQNSHAFWRTTDKGHPLYTAELAAAHGDYLPWLYGEMDRALGLALKACDDQTLLFALSDHGFNSFRRQFNLNSWLLENGYATLTPGADRQGEYFSDVRWGETRAYGLGINSLYLNMAGREPEGCVKAGDREGVRGEIAERLLAAVDPATGEHPVYRVCRPEEIYRGPQVANAPDLIIGYAPNYRASWDTILGKYPLAVYLDNLDPWSGDHCIDALFMSGCLFSNRRFEKRDPALEDLAPAILQAMT